LFGPFDRDWRVAAVEISDEYGSLSICLVTPHNFPEGDGGGEERFLNYFCHFLTSRKIKVTVISSAAETNTQQTSGVGIRPFRLPLLGLTPYMLLFSVAATVKIILMNKSRNFSLIHSIDTGYGGLAGLFASKILRLHFIAHSHCQRSYLLKLTILSRNDFTRHIAFFYEKFEVSIDKLVSRNADFVVAVSDEIKRYICSLGVSSEKVAVIPMGLDTAAFEPKVKDKEELFREFGIPHDAFVIGYVGSLVKPKGVDLLVKAFSVLQNRGDFNPYLLMVGSGEYKKEVENMVREGNLRSVILPGFRKDVAKLLGIMSVFVLPSFSEGCPFALLEAMAAGKAIIASNIPSIREIVEDEKDSILIDPNDYGMLEKAILRLYYDPKLRENLGRNAKRRARHYDMYSSFNRFVGLYNYYQRRD
jgi:glycosyltransferase involved in cell wall biosynthesis